MKTITMFQLAFMSLALIGVGEAEAGWLFGRRRQTVQYYTPRVQVVQQQQVVKKFPPVPKPPTTQELYPNILPNLTIPELNPDARLEALTSSEKTVDGYIAEAKTNGSNTSGLLKQKAHYRMERVKLLAKRGETVLALELLREIEDILDSSYVTEMREWIEKQGE